MGDPITAALLGVGGLLSGVGPGTAAFLFAALPTAINVSLLTGLTLITSSSQKNALNRQRNKAVGQEYVVPGGVVPAQTAFGETACGGAYLYSNVKDAGYSKKMIYRDEWYAHSQQPGGIEGVVGFFFDNDYARFPQDFTATADGGWALTSLTRKESDDFDWTKHLAEDTEGSRRRPRTPSITIWIQDGSTPGPPPVLLRDYAEITDAWEARDIFSTHVRFAKGYDEGKSFSEAHDNRKLWQSDVPTIRPVFQSTKCFDPRDSDQDVNDRSTWKYSRNPAMAYGYYKMVWEGAPAEDVDWEWVTDWADNNDGQVPDGSGGMEVRYTCNGMISLTASHEDNLQVILDSGDAEQVYTEGKWRPVCGKWRPPEIEIGPEDILGEVSYQSGYSLDQRPNTIHSHYRDGAVDHKDATIVPRVDANALREDGRAIPADLALPMVTSDREAQRHAQRVIDGNRGQEHVTVPLSWMPFTLGVGSTFNLRLPPLFGAPKTFRVKQIAIGGQTPIAIDAEEDHEDFWRDMDDAEYSSETPGGEVIHALQRPASPYNFRAVGSDGRVVWRWSMNGEEGEEARLWTSATPQFADASLAAAGDMEEFVELLPDINTATPRYGWVASVIEGVFSLRTPDDDVSSVTAIATVPEVTHSGPLPRAGRPDAALGVHGNSFRADDGRFFRKFDPARSVFNPNVPLGERSGVYWRAPSRTFALPSDVRMALDDEVFVQGGVGYFGTQSSLDMTTGAARIKFFGTEINDGVVAPDNEALRTEAVDADDGPVIFRVTPSRVGLGLANRVTLFSGSIRPEIIFPAKYIVGTEVGYFDRIVVETDGSVGVLFRLSTGSGTLAGPQLTADALANLNFILHADGIDDDLVFDLSAGTTTDTTEPYSLDDVPGAAAWATAYRALAAVPETSITIYDKSADDFKLPGKRLSPFHARALRLAARRGDQEVVWGPLSAPDADGFYGCVISGGTLSALQSAAGDWTFALVNVTSLPNSDALPLRLWNWEILGRSGLVAYHASSYWRMDGTQWVPGGDTPADITVSGRWESDGRVVALVSVTFEASPVNDTLMIEVKELTSVGGVTGADTNRVRSKIGAFELIFFYNQVPLYITASHGVVGGRRNNITPPPEIPGVPGPLNLTEVPGHTVFGFTFPQTNPAWTSVSFRWQLDSGIGVGGVSPAAWSSPVTVATGSVQLTGLSPARFYIAEAVPSNAEGTGPVTIHRFLTEENKSPVANAGPNQAVLVGTSVTLDGSATTDPDVPPDPIIYDWDQFSPATPMPTLTGADTASASFIAPAAGALLDFRLTASDRHGGSSSDETFVAVRSEDVTADANGCPDKDGGAKGDHILVGAGADAVMWRRGELPEDILRNNIVFPGEAGIIGWARGGAWFNVAGTNTNIQRGAPPSAQYPVTLSGISAYGQVNPQDLGAPLLGTVVADSLTGFTGAPGFRLLMPTQLRQDVVDNLALMMVNWSRLKGEQNNNLSVFTDCTQTLAGSGMWNLDFRTWNIHQRSAGGPIPITTRGQANAEMAHYRSLADGSRRIGYLLIDKRQRCPDNLHDNPWHKAMYVDEDAQTTFNRRPPQPLNTRATGITSTSFKVEWDPASLLVNGVETVTAYRVTMENVTSPGMTFAPMTVSSPTTHLDFPDLTPNNRYRWTVESRTGVADRDHVYSRAFFVGRATTLPATSPPPDPEPPVTPTVAPGAPSVTIGGITTVGFTATFTAGSGGLPNSFTVEWRKDGDTGSWSSASITSSSGSFAVTGLEAGTLYDWRVQAVNTAGTSPYTSGQVTTSTRVVVPGAPTVSASGVSNSAATVEWAPASSGGAAASWEIGYKVGTDTEWTDATATSATRAFALSDLNASTTYDIRVRGVNSAGNGAYGTATFTTSAAPVPVKVPDAPTVSDSGVTRNAATIEWTPAATGDAATSWEAGYRIGTGSWTTMTFADATTRSWALTGLTAGTTYSTRVRGINSAGNGAYGTDTFTTAAPPPVIKVPNAPSVSDSGVDNDSATIEWTAATTGDDATSWEAGYRIGTGAWTTRTFSDASTRSWSVTGLTASTTYSTRVRGVNSAGNGAYGTDTFTTTAAPVVITVPGAPSVRDSHVSHNAGRINWTPSSTGSPATSWEVGHRIGTGAWTTRTFTAGVRLWALGGLSASTTYSTRVRGVNSAGQGAYGTDTFTTSAPPVPNKPTARVGSVTHNSAVGAWTPGAGPSATSWDTQFREGSSGAWSNGPINLTAATRTAALSGLKASTSYQFRVRGSNAAGDGAYSDPVSFTTTAAPLPHKPTARVGSITLTGATGSWTPASTGPTATSWDTQFREGSSGAWSNGPLNLSALTRTASLTGLKVNTAHQFRVRGTNADGDGAYSDPVAFTTRNYIAPGAPSVTIDSIAQTSFRVNWTMSTAGHTPTSWDVEYKLSSSSSWTSAATGLAASARQHSITGLTVNTAYDVRVRARNQRGAGAWGTASATTAAQAVPSAPSMTLSGATQTSITATWVHGSGGSAPAGWELEWGTDSTFAVKSSATLAVTTLTSILSSLSAATTYYVRVRAFDGQGRNGAWSTTASLATAAPTTLQPPRNIRFTRGANSLTVTADPPVTTAAVTGYDIQYRAGGTGSWTNLLSNGSSPTATATGLDSASSYEFRLRSKGANNLNSAWAHSTFDPDTLFSAARSLAFSANPGATTLTATYTAPSRGTPAAYEYQYKRSGQPDSSYSAAARSTGLSISLTGLSENEYYVLRVRPVDSNGWAGAWASAWGKTNDLTTTPDFFVMNIEGGIWFIHNGVTEIRRRLYPASGNNRPAGLATNRIESGGEWATQIHIIDRDGNVYVYDIGRDADGLPNELQLSETRSMSSAVAQDLDIDFIIAFDLKGDNYYAAIETGDGALGVSGAEYGGFILGGPTFFPLTLGLSALFGSTVRDDVLAVSSTGRQLGKDNNEGVIGIAVQDAGVYLLDFAGTTSFEQYTGTLTRTETGDISFTWGIQGVQPRDACSGSGGRFFVMGTGRHERAYCYDSSGNRQESYEFNIGNPRIREVFGQDRFELVDVQRWWSLTAA